MVSIALVASAQSANPDTVNPPSLKARAEAALSVIHGTLKVTGLQQPVNVLRDRWGVAHIYARNQHDLFFAQGFVAAQDRLFQMELWKRSGQGRLAEILGPSALLRDINARLLTLSRRHEGRIRKLLAGYPGHSRSLHRGNQCVHCKPRGRRRPRPAA